MSVGTRSDFVRKRFRDLIRQGVLGFCGAGEGSVATTFTLYRRTLVDPEAPQRDDRGIMTRPTIQEFAIVVADEPCLFGGTNPKSQRWQVNPEGQEQIEQTMLETAYLDVREGDNLILAYDGKTYLVEASTYAGPVLRVFISTAKAQL